MIIEKGLRLALKLFRIRPVVAWTVTSFVLVLMSGIYDGLQPDWFIAALSLIGVILLQGTVSHAVNDIADEKVDKYTDILATGRTKVLVDGTATKTDLYALIFITILIVWTIVWYAFWARGYVIMLLIFAGMFYIYAYNFRPFKLNYKPFAEYTVVIPVILLISIGFSYSIFGDISRTVMYSAVANSLMNVSWYFFSRLQDVRPDNMHDKVTTFVWIHRNFKHSSASKLLDMSLFYIYVSLLLYSYVILLNLGRFYYVTSCMILLYALITAYYYKLNKVHSMYEIGIFASRMRTVGMYITYANCVLLSLTLYLYK